MLVNRDKHSLEQRPTVMTTLTDSKGSLLNNVRHLLVAMPELIINTCSIFLGGSSTLNLLSRPFFLSVTTLEKSFSADFRMPRFKLAAAGSEARTLPLCYPAFQIFVSSQVTILTNGAVVFNERIF